MDGILFLGLIILILIIIFTLPIANASRDQQLKEVDKKRKKYISSLSYKANQINKLKNKKDEELTIKLLKANKFKFLEDKGIYLMKPGYRPTDKNFQNKMYKIKQNGRNLRDSNFLQMFSYGVGTLTLYIDSVHFISDTRTEVIKLKPILDVKAISVDYGEWSKNTANIGIYRYPSKEHFGVLIASSSFKTPKTFIGFWSDDLFVSVIKKLIRINNKYESTEAIPDNELDSIIHCFNTASYPIEDRG